MSWLRDRLNNRAGSKGRWWAPESVTESDPSPSPRRPPREWKVSRRSSLVCVAVGVALTGYALISGIAAPDNYRVTFAEPGTLCSDNKQLVLDLHTGAPLYCGFIGNKGDSFSPDEEQRITDLVRARTSDGLSSEDRAEIEAVARSIASAHADQVGWLPRIAVLFGIPTIVIGIFFAIFSNRNIKRAS